ncbi:MAG: hypothetical protein AAF663_09870 [Planctomycetota bacterium]
MPWPDTPTPEAHEDVLAGTRLNRDGCWTTEFMSLRTASCGCGGTSVVAPKSGPTVTHVSPADPWLVVTVGIYVFFRTVRFILSDT